MADITLNENMSFWKMGKYLASRTGNVALHSMEGLDQFADAFNNIGQAANAGSRVVKDYALIEEAEAQALLNEKTLKLN